MTCCSLRRGAGWLGWQLDVVKGLEDTVAVVGHTVEFCCQLTEPVPEAEVNWYANGAELKAGDTWAMRADGCSYHLVLRQAPALPIQEITFAARDAISMAKLTVIGTLFGRFCLPKILDVSPYSHLSVVWDLLATSSDLPSSV